jgi:glycosyltransferase involved in cell wall biosynthesis
MRLAFIDPTQLDYTAATPRERPLGGMQSAACYLAGALAARGHDVTLLTRTTTPGTYEGVACVQLTTVDLAAFNSFDAIVCISTGSVAFRQVGMTRPLVLWTGHDVDQPPVQALRDPAERALWDKVVLVSDWQARRYSQTFKINPAQIAVIGNAIAPAFERVPPKSDLFFASGRPPVLIYSSTPFRGLDVLLGAFPRIRQRVPGCEARIYSSLAVYQTAAAEDPHRALYELASRTEGVQYMGSVGQDALAAAMGQSDVFAYPSTFAETSCIALMEAMVSGCMVISTTLGALQETSAGFGRFCELPPDPAHAPEAYGEFVGQHIADARANSDRWAAQLAEQRAFALKHYVWSRRAAEWEQMLDVVSRQPAQTTVPRRNDRCRCGSGLRFKHCCGASA